MIMKRTNRINRLRITILIAFLSVINSNIIDNIFSQRDSEYIFLNDNYKYSFSKDGHQYLLVVYGSNKYNNIYDGIKIKYTPRSTDIPPYNKNVVITLNFINKFFTIEYDNKCLNRWNEKVSNLSIEYITKNYDALSYFILPGNKNQFLTYILDIAEFIPLVPTINKESEENYEGSGRDVADSTYLKKFNTAQILIDPIYKSIRKLNLRFIGYEINDLIAKEENISLYNEYFYPDDRAKCNLASN